MSEKKINEKATPIGIISSSRTPTIAEMIALSPVPIGSYVYTRFQVRERIRGEDLLRDVEVIGIVTNASYQPAVPMSILSLAREDVRETASRTSRFNYSPMNIYVIADVSGGEATVPVYPIPPGAEVYLAHDIDPNPLERVYKRSRSEAGLIRIGSLARFRDVEIAVDVNKLYKHLLIAGATGSGKSNAVAVLIDRISRLGAPIIVFDVHGEYTSLRLEDHRTIEVVRAQINPLEIDKSVLVRLIIPEPAATKQRRVFRKAFREVYKEIKEKARKLNLSLPMAVEALFRSQQEGLKEVAEDLFEERGSDPDKLDAVEKFHVLMVDKIRKTGVGSSMGKVVSDVEDKYVDFIFSTPILSFDAVNPLNRISPGKIIVYDVSDLTDYQKAWILRMLAEELLDLLKRRYREEGFRSRIPPIVLVIEEAPLFISKESDRFAKESIKKIAREGRKFGGILVVVSQRPRVLDPDISSQIQNYLFLKLVQEEDIASVMNIADNLEESLARTLTSLPTGWGILMGEWVGRFPALVAVDKHEGKTAGASPDLVAEWREYREWEERGSLAPSEFPGDGVL
ncbi:MAG: ATP-binding protein [Sulfolobales archaeon]